MADAVIENLVSPASLITGQRSLPQMTIQQLLREVYIAHLEDIKKQKVLVESKQQENDKLQKQFVKLSERAKDYKKEYVNCKEVTRKLQVELDELRNRVVAPCQNCSLLRKSVEEMKHLYNMALDDKDRSIARLENGIEGGKQTSGGRIIRGKNEDEYYEEVGRSSCKAQIKSSHKSPRKKQIFSDEKSPRKSPRKTHIFSEIKSPENSPHKNSARKGILTDLPKSSSGSNQTESTGSHDAKGAGEEDLLFGEDISPGGSVRSRSRVLRLARTSKKRYTEESIGPAEKRKKISPKKSNRSSHSHGFEQNNKNEVVLVPETCNMETSLEMEEVDLKENRKDSKKHRVAEKDKTGKMKMAVPETLPLSPQQTVEEADCTVIEQASTKQTNLNQAPSVHSSQKINNTKILSSKKRTVTKTAQQDLWSPENDVFNEEASQMSSVFISSREEILKRHEKQSQPSRSPSLFEEDEGDLISDETKKIGNESGKRSKTSRAEKISAGQIIDINQSIDRCRNSSLIDTSKQSEPSPSLLTSRSQRTSSKSMNESSPKLTVKVQQCAKPSPGSSTRLRQTSLDSFKEKMRNSKKKIKLGSAELLPEEKADLETALKNSLLDMGNQSAILGDFDCIMTDDMENLDFPITSTPAATLTTKTRASPRMKEKSQTFKKPCTPSIMSPGKRIRQSPNQKKKVALKFDPDETRHTATPTDSVHSRNGETSVSSAGVKSYLNGTVDPNLCLSQYDSEAVDEAVEESHRLLPNDEESQSIIPSGVSVTFGKVPKRPMIKQDDLDDEDIGEDEAEWSFDRVPKKAEPAYKYDVVIRKKAERDKLEGDHCACCEGYYDNMGLTVSQKQERMKLCSRHKAKFLTAGTPPHFWSVGFPDTQECEERGYLQKTQHKPSTHRRRRGYKKLFKTEKEEKDEESQEDSEILN